ncbi:unnamed protein product [Clavelina lepadiformis]|uniref:Uncharacterized protein n=1 Tax=Clavelina lepadiformis TaxID=159417 RepID=A0ABP0GL79_CLALP
MAPPCVPPTAIWHKLDISYLSTWKAEEAESAELLPEPLCSMSWEHRKMFQALERDEATARVVIQIISFFKCVRILPPAGFSVNKTFKIQKMTSRSKIVSSPSY